MYAGFDIGGTTARFIVVTEDGEVVANNKTQSRGWSPEETCTFIERQIETFDGDIDDPIGIAIAGQLSRDSSVVINAPNLGWKHVALQELIEEKSGRKARLINDLNAAVYAEYEMGAAEGFRHVLGVFVGSGVGGSIIHRGRLVRGAANVAGEIGHVKVSTEPTARMCGCGQRGCLEAYAGGVHLEAMVSELLPALAKSRVVDVAKADAMIDENPSIGDIWEFGASALATAIANACTLLNPAVLVLGGGVLNNAPQFKARTMKLISPRISKTAATALEIRFAELGDRGGALGAALIVRSNI